MIIKENYTIPGCKGRLMCADITFDNINPQAPLVIFIHGFKSFKDWGAHNLIAHYFAEHGFRFLKFNFSHNGTSPDQPVEINDLITFSENTFSMELDDLEKIIDFACNGSSLPYTQSVILMGHSMGGGISIIKAAGNARVSKLVTLASIADFRNLWTKNDEHQWRMQCTMYIQDEQNGRRIPVKGSLLADLDRNAALLNITHKAAEITQPWLIIHGDNDTGVPLKHAYELKAAQPAAELSIIKKADHVFNASHPFIFKSLPPALLRLCDEAITFLRN